MEIHCYCMFSGTNTEHKQREVKPKDVQNKLQSMVWCPHFVHELQDEFCTNQGSKMSIVYGWKPCQVYIQMCKTDPHLDCAERIVHILV